MKKTLAEIIEDHQRLEFELIESGGLLTDEIQSRLEHAEMELGEKLDGYASFIAYEKGQIEYLKSQERLYKDRRTTIENAIESMRDRMAFAITVTGLDKVKTVEHNYSVRITQSWKLKDELRDGTTYELVEAGLGRFDFKPDMKAIKDAFADNPPVFVDVVEKQSITIR